VTGGPVPPGVRYGKTAGLRGKFGDAGGNPGTSFASVRRHKRREPIWRGAHPPEVWKTANQLVKHGGVGPCGRQNRYATEDVV